MIDDMLILLKRTKDIHELVRNFLCNEFLYILDSRELGKIQFKSDLSLQVTLCIKNEATLGQLFRNFRIGPLKSGRGYL